MPDPAFDVTDGTIEVVRGQLGEQRAEQLVRFLSDHGSLDEVAARRHLPEVVCCLLGAVDEIVGINSVVSADIGLIGGRRFWIYQSLLLPGAADAGPAMIRAAFSELEKEFDPRGEGPIGLCLLIRDRADMVRRPQAEWSDPRIIYAGYLADGRQVRIGYFQGAKI